MESARGEAERVLHTAVAAVGVDLRDEGASLDLFGGTSITMSTGHCSFSNAAMGKRTYKEEK